MTAGTYGGATFGSLFGLGGGLFVDNYGRVYPQFYGGTPKWALSAGYTPDLEALLTGTSISGGLGSGSLRLNAAASGGATGIGFGTPGIGVTYGFGPLEMSKDFSQPWAAAEIHDSAAAAGVPSRYNVWEYDYPASSTDNPAAPISSSAELVNPEANERSNSSPFTGHVDSTPTNGLASRIAAFAGINPPAAGRPAALPQMGLGRVSPDQPLRVFDTSASPVPYLAQNRPGGLFGMMIRAGHIDPSISDRPSPGGMVRIIQDYLRGNPGASVGG